MFGWMWSVLTEVVYWVTSMVLGEGLGDWIYTVLATLDCLGLVKFTMGEEICWVFWIRKKC